MGWTSIGVLSEVWVGGRRDTGSGSDWGEHLRKTGSGPHTMILIYIGVYSHKYIEHEITDMITKTLEKGLSISILIDS